LHRHSIPQLAIDGVLVALAYFLAYRLRFDAPGGVPERYQELFEATIFPVVAGSLSSSRFPALPEVVALLELRDSRRSPARRRRDARRAAYVAVAARQARAEGASASAPAGVLALFCC
jgi:hypothetical protein